VYGSSAATFETGISSIAQLSGYVEFYGYHSAAAGWFFSGWIANPPDLFDRLKEVVAWFGDERVMGPVTPLLFGREDVGDAAIGFLIFLKSEETPAHALSCIRIGIESTEQGVYPVINAPMLPEAKLTPQLGFVIARADDQVQRLEMEFLLVAEPDSANAGLIEYFGFHHAAGGWFMNGWIARAESDVQKFDRMTISFENGDVRGEVVVCTYARADLREGVSGLILFMRAPLAALGPLCIASLYFGRSRVLLAPITSVPQYRETELVSSIKSSLGLARPSLGSERLLNLLSRRHYTGENTLETLSPSINFYIDEAINCGTSGLTLIGWMLAKPGEISQIRVHCGAMTAVLAPALFMKIDRPDVLAAMVKHGFDDASCGFATFVSGEFDLNMPIYIEIETRRCQTAFLNVPLKVRAGMAAIRHLLSINEPRYTEIQPAFDRVLGPAIEALNGVRLAAHTGFELIDYGRIPQTPAFSVIVPLHGRLDFVEYQQALFCNQPKSTEIEYIYVLDDPSRRREAQLLFASVYERFKIPFRLVLLEENVGFAPANNVGLHHAHGQFVVYLNSDVFPGTENWLERLASAFTADPFLGAIGPQLLFEDGSVQHTGMYFERLPEYGNWFFCQHHGKGLRYSGTGALQYFPAITGACIVLRRETAMQMGGFDETYIIGDFEDSDLCLKLYERGLKCAVDPTVQLYHLERKSQLSGAVGWRANLTAYNAWQHDRRWSKTIDSLQFSNGGRLS
jgi:GT2 family glycosyltransferase